MNSYRDIPSLRLKDVVDERLGVSEFVRPMVHTIEVVFLPNLKESYKYSFDEFFMRLPPFEPITIRSSIYGQNTLKGDYVWFVTTTDKLVKKNERDNIINVYKTVENHYRNTLPEIRCDEIICGEYEDIGIGVILRRLYIPRIIGDGIIKWYKKIKLQLNDSTDVEIVYGFTPSTIRDWKNILSNKLNIKDTGKILNDPDKTLSIPEIIQEFKDLEKKSKSYSPFTLNYISSCYGGRFITTDPFSRGKLCERCEKQSRSRILCRNAPGYRIYHWRRKAFPRVYTILYNAIATYDIEELSQYYRVPFTCVFSEGIRCIKKVDAFDISFDIGKSRLKLLKPIISDYFTTNAFLVIVDKLFIETFINIIKKSGSKVSCVIPICGNNVRIPLVNILASKFIWRNISMQEQGYDMDLKFEEDKNELQLIIIIDKDKYEITSSGVNHLIGRIFETKEFIEFIEESLAHTLAHSIYIGLSNAIPYFDEYGSYLSIVDRNYVISGVIENTREGTLKLLKPTIVLLNNEIYLENREKGLAVFKPGAIAKILKDVIETIDKRDNVKEVSDTCATRDETIKHIIYAVLSRIREEINFESNKNLSKKDTELVLSIQDTVEKVINVIIAMLEKLINKILMAGVFIDRYSFTSTILWKILREASIRQNIVKGIKFNIKEAIELNNIYDLDLEELVDLIFDILVEVEMSKLITDILLPDYCSDGCEIDLHLPRCSKYLEQPYLISRCLLITFLRFAGIPVAIPQLKIERFECDGAELKTLSSLARENLGILTYILGEDGIKILSKILDENQRIKINIEIDKRFRDQNLEIVKSLEDLMNKYKGRFNVIYTSEPHHGKLIIADLLKIHTSWNFGSGDKTRQTYIGEIYS